MNTGGAYSSGHETMHRIGMAIGSTAGYSHNFIKAGNTAFVGGKTVASHTGAFTKSTSDATVLGSFVNGKYTNKILASTNTNAAGHDLKLADAAKDAAVQAFIASTEAGGAINDSNKMLFVSSADEVADVDASHKIQLNGGQYPKSLIYVEFNNPATTTLQESELEIMNAP